MKRLKKILFDLWHSANKWVVIIAIIFAFVFGYIFRGGPGIENSSRQPTELEGHEEAKIKIWTCSMHPQIKKPNPGKCPLCGMDLIPVMGSGDDREGMREVRLTENAIKLASIETAAVERRYVSSDIRLVGKVVTDETRIKHIAAWVPGRIDKLFVDYTGIQVNKGDHLVSLYSPDLITAQQELIEAKKMPLEILEAARDKLRLWGLNDHQIKEIEKRESVEENVTIYSPIGGIVIQKNASEGMYVNTGTRIYTIADLSTIWVKLDAYESDLLWIRYGQTVEFETEAYPGERFRGKIAFIDPIINQETRTVKVRVNVPNLDGRLKPEMFVKATVQSKLSASGKIMDEDLMGKWISPMHPEIVKDGPGRCDICGMPLVKAEDLGYVNAIEQPGEKPLVIPASAPLLTGTRAVVYLAIKGKKGSFEGREVILGSRAGNYYLVKEGLTEGEEVVVNGAFKIDSDLQIQAKPSMMSPEGGVAAPGHHHHESVSKAVTEEKPVLREEIKESTKNETVPRVFQKSIDDMAADYFAIQGALSRDSLDVARESASSLLKKLARVDMKLLKGNLHMEWMKLEKKIGESGNKLAIAGDLEAARVNFELLTEPVAAAIKTFGGKETPVYRFHCSMAFNNKGAYWLQKNSETRNPYFGVSMLTCKDYVEILVPEKKQD